MDVGMFDVCYLKLFNASYVWQVLVRVGIRVRVRVRFSPRLCCVWQVLVLLTSLTAGALKGFSIWSASS